MAQRINRRLSRIENFFSMLLTKGKISDNIFVGELPPTTSKNWDDFVNVEYIKGMFWSKKELLDFILQKEEKKCMEYENKIVFSDDRAAAFIGKLFGISSPYKLERLKIDEQIKKCRIMRNRGLSASQITRITGISRRIIRMAKS